MKKLILFLICIFMTSFAFAATDVYIRDGIDTSNLLDVTSNGAAKIVNGVANGTGYASQAVIYAAGQRISLGTSTNVIEVIISAHPYNIGNIFVGGANVSSTNGTAVASNQILILRVNNLSNWYVTSTVGSSSAPERITYLTITE